MVMVAQPWEYTKNVESYTLNSELFSMWIVSQKAVILKPYVRLKDKKTTINNLGIQIKLEKE